MVETTSGIPSSSPAAAVALPGSEPGAGDPIRAVTIASPSDGATVPSGALSVDLLVVPGFASDRIVVTAYPLPSPPGVPVSAPPVTPLPATQPYSVSLGLPPNTHFALTAVLLDSAGVQRDVAMIQVSTGP